MKKLIFAVVAAAVAGAAGHSRVPGRRFRDRARSDPAGAATLRLSRSNGSAATGPGRSRAHDQRHGEGVEVELVGL